MCSSASPPSCLSPCPRRSHSRFGSRSPTARCSPETRSPAHAHSPASSESPAARSLPPTTNSSVRASSSPRRAHRRGSTRRSRLRHRRRGRSATRAQARHPGPGSHCGRLRAAPEQFDRPRGARPGGTPSTRTVPAWIRPENQNSEPPSPSTCASRAAYRSTPHTWWSPEDRAKGCSSSCTRWGRGCAWALKTRVTPACVA